MKVKMFECLQCRSEIPEHDLVIIEEFAETRLEPSEHLMNCPHCNSQNVEAILDDELEINGQEVAF